MKTENFVTWILLGYIAWKISQATSGAGAPCGGSTTVPDGFGVNNVLQAAWTGNVAGGALGGYVDNPYMSGYEDSPYMSGCNCK